MDCMMVHAYHLQADLWVQAPQSFLSVPEEGKKKKKKRLR